MNNQPRFAILYLDDEPICLEVFRDTFGDEYLVRAVQTVAEARRALASEGVFDVIISDQSMPELDGVTFLSEAAAASPDSYRVLLTGNVGVGDCFREIAAGVVQLFIAKPWDVSHIRRVLELAEAAARLRASTSRTRGATDRAA